MLELRVISGTSAVPLSYLPSLMGRRNARVEIGDQIETLIAFMDAMDGDPDFEDATDAEDDFNITDGARAVASGAGCEISDAGGCEHDGREPSWTEASSLRGIPVAGVNDDDEANGDEQDGTGAEDEWVAWFKGLNDGPGCIVSDPDSEHDGREQDDGL